MLEFSECTTPVESAMPSVFSGNESLLWTLGIFSLASAIVTMAVVPWIIVQIPSDYFSKPRRTSIISSKLPASLRILILLIKNAFGLALVALGIVMLVIPGQGLLTILIGLMLVDFPRKYRYQRWLIAREPVLRSANWLRTKGGKPPLSLN